MTEPVQNEYPDFPAASGPAAEDVAQLSNPGAGQVVNPPTPTAESGEKVLATYAPHTFHASDEHVITPHGTRVPSDQADDYIESAAQFGVHVYEKEQ
jgi:hypothetical protein